MWGDGRAASVFWPSPIVNWWINLQFGNEFARVSCTLYQNVVAFPTTVGPRVELLLGKMRGHL